MALSVRVERKHDACVVSPSGSIDSTTYEDLGKEFNSILEKPVKVIIVNMEEVSYISSMGLGILVKIMKAVRKDGGIFMLSNLQPQVKKVFDIVKALPDVNIFESIEEADAYFDKIQRGEIG